MCHLIEEVVAERMSPGAPLLQSKWCVKAGHQGRQMSRTFNGKALMLQKCIAFI
jgi:hypothetical protein